MSRQVKLGEVTEPAQAADDELGVLRAVVDDGDLRAHGNQDE